MFNTANNEHIENKRVGTLNALFFKERDDVDEQGQKCSRIFYSMSEMWKDAYLSSGVCRQYDRLRLRL